MALELIKDYCANSQFHGLRFLAHKDRHWTERVFWFVCICASWYGCFLVIVSSWDAFQNNPLSFGTETTYIEWNTSLLAVSVCEHEKNEDRVDIIAERLFGSSRNWNIDEVLRQITFFKGNAYYIKEFCFGVLDCPKNGYKRLSAMIRTPCNETFEYCSWNDVEFDCCEYFQILETELGPCYTLNSIQVNKPKNYPLTSNRETGPGTLRLELQIFANVYVHSPEDVPYLNTYSSEYVQADLKGVLKRRLYSITEIVNEREVHDVDISHRRCRYPDENYLKTYKYYSYTACVVECRAKEQMRLCNCTSHLTPRAKEDTICDLNGLKCLSDHLLDYSVIIKPWTQRQGLVCPCLPGCSEPEYDLIEEGKDEMDDDETSIVQLSLARLTSIRLKRSVVRGRLDLVVSMGGTAGLFVGASLLSFVELIYFFTMRIYGTLKMKKKNEKEDEGKRQRKIPISQKRLRLLTTQQHFPEKYIKSDSRREMGHDHYDSPWRFYM